MATDDPTDQIIDALTAADYDYSIQEIADCTGLSRETVSKYIHVLLAEDRIQQTRTVGRAKLYTDMES